jgi:hypothetical protein
MIKIFERMTQNERYDQIIVLYNVKFLEVLIDERRGRLC